MRNGFPESNGQCLQVDNAFKDPKHPFRVAIVCAMWLTGFDVECLATLYIDKPMRAHNLMQAIARANRVYGDKDCGVIVDYNGVMKSLREALALYALGDDGADDKNAIVIPIEERVKALVQGLNEAEQHLGKMGFDVASLQGTTGFDRIQALRDAVEAVYTSDETKRRFEIMAREMFSRFKALITEPAVYTFAERHDNIEAIYKKLEEKRDNADVTDLLKELHKIVNEAIRAQGVGVDHAEGLTVDLSRINFEKLREEFEKRVTRKHAALADIRQVVEQRLAAMLAQNPKRMDYYAKYQQIVAVYNREKDRATVEYTFAQFMDLASALDAEQRRCVEEGLSDDELALFDLIQQDKISKADRERVKQSSRQLLDALRGILASMQQWTAKEQTQAEVQTLILDQLHRTLPIPPLTPDDADAAAARIYDYVWQRSEAGWNPARVSASG
jgi:type I restriction enzyme R subunit